MPEPADSKVATINLDVVAIRMDVAIAVVVTFQESFDELQIAGEGEGRDMFDEGAGTTLCD